MFSYEDRIRAVELYIKMGKRTGATIRHLGYPTKNSLKSWYEEYKLRLDLPSGYRRSKPKYSQHQKVKAVEHYVQHGCCIAFTTKTLGYPGLDSLRAWIAELRPEMRKLVVARAESPPRPPAMKKAAVIELCTRQGSAHAVAQELGVCRPTLYHWKNQLLGPEKPASMKRRHETPPSSEREQLERQIESLRRDVYRLQLEHDLLKKANEIVKKDTGIDRQVLTNREKTMLVDALKQTYPLSELREALGLARSTYFYQRAKSKVTEKYAEVRHVMAELFQRNHRCYGYRRMRAMLSRQCLSLSEKVIQRLMKQERLVVAKPKRRRYGSYLGEISPAPENHLNRNFAAAAPNQK